MKVNLKPRTMMHPAPAVVVSAYDDEGNADACTLAFAAMCSHKPPAVMIAINSTLKRKTLKSILATNEFALAFPSFDQHCEADYLGIASGYDTDKLKDIGYTYEKGQTVNAPVINEFMVSLECMVIDTKTVGSHTQITGEILNVQADESVLDGKGKISFEKLNPLCYDDVQHTYFSIGNDSVKAFRCGLKFRD